MMYTQKISSFGRPPMLMLLSANSSWPSAPLMSGNLYYIVVCTLAVQQMHGQWIMTGPHETDPDYVINVNDTVCKMVNLHGT